MSFSLLTQKWLPLQRRSGVVEWVSPADITDNLALDPFVRPDWGRADLDAATYEFLIGLFATAYNPEEEKEDWRENWNAPPSPARIAEALAPFEAAFQLFGDGPRFMQEFGGVAAESGPVSGLFIESPGANAEKNNTDLFQKRGQLTVLGPEAAAMALFALQSFAPAGGAGHRTSLRGGGPLTTLVLPREDSLWAKIWLNVPTNLPALPEPLDATLFPWLAPTRTSETGKTPLPFEDMHPLAAFWWMPRRITLEVSQQDDARCDLTGRAAPIHVRSYRTKPSGMNGKGVKHPLSPMYRAKANDLEWLFVHPQPGGLTYALWIDLAFAGEVSTTLKRPSEMVTHILNRRASKAEQPLRLWAAGYDMDNMKARGFYETTFPLFVLKSDEAAKATRNLINGSAEVLLALKYAVRKALSPKDATGKPLWSLDAVLLTNMAKAFYSATEAAFFSGVKEFADAFEKDPHNSEIHLKVATDFLQDLSRTALRLFDQVAELPSFSLREKEIKQMIGARLDLTLMLRGYGASGAALMKSLNLPVPQSQTEKTSRKVKDSR